ncbi:MAG: hypothetical protein MK212_18940, partial [Saprospiraceae bacterium]|nr:hypothetical protein [Saprospiraceae bacterium]
MDKIKQEALLDAHSKYIKLKQFYDQHQDVLKDKIPTDALKIMEKAAKDFEGYGDLLQGQMEDQDNIPKKEFIDEVLELMENYKTSENKSNIANLSQYSVDIEQFRGLFGARVLPKLKTPFFKELANEISKANTISDINGILNRYIGLKKADLAKHYKVENNKEYYKGESVETYLLASDLDVIKLTDSFIEESINDLNYEPYANVNEKFNNWISLEKTSLKELKTQSNNFQITNSQNVVSGVETLLSSYPELATDIVKQIPKEEDITVVSLCDLFSANLETIQNTNDLELYSITNSQMDNLMKLSSSADTGAIISNRIKGHIKPSEVIQDINKFASDFKNLLIADTLLVANQFDNAKNNYTIDYPAFSSSVYQMLEIRRDCDKAVVKSILGRVKAKFASKLTVKYQDFVTEYKSAIVATSENPKVFFEIYGKEKCGLPSSYKLDIIASSVNDYADPINADEMSETYHHYLKTVARVLDEVATKNGWSDSTLFSVDKINTEFGGLFKEPIFNFNLASIIYDNHWKVMTSSLSGNCTLEKFKEQFDLVMNNEIPAQAALKSFFEKELENS